MIKPRVHVSGAIFYPASGVLQQHQARAQGARTSAETPPLQPTRAELLNFFLTALLMGWKERGRHGLPQ
jgi:hypothetical protein